MGNFRFPLLSQDWTGRYFSALQISLHEWFVLWRTCRKKNIYYMILGEKSSTRNHQRDFRSFMITKSTSFVKSWHAQPLFPLFFHSRKCRDWFPRGQTKKVSVHDLYPMNFENASGAAEHKNSSSKACLVSVSCVSLQLSLSHLVYCSTFPCLCSKLKKWSTTSTSENDFANTTAFMA